MSTILALLGVVLMVAGITLALVTGLDLRFAAAGVLIAAAGALVLRRAQSLAPPLEDSTLFTGRSVQKPLSESKPSNPERRGRL